MPPGLLEVGELRDLHAVEHHLPADAPGAERRRLPVVLLEADVVLRGLMPHASRLSRYSCCTSSGAGLRITWNWWCLKRRFGFSPKPAVGRTARRLHVGDVPVRRPEHAQERLGVHGAGADLDVERLLSAQPREAQNSDSLR
jgi:hypothetical protein